MLSAQSYCDFWFHSKVIFSKEIFDTFFMSYLTKSFSCGFCAVNSFYVKKDIERFLMILLYLIKGLWASCLLFGVISQMGQSCLMLSDSLKI